MKTCNSIFYTKSYFKFVEICEETSVNCFTFNDGDYFALFPYFLKNNTLSSLRYGGIYANTKNTKFSEKTRSAFLEFCVDNKIKKIKIRENPFIHTVKIGKTTKKEPFVWIDLAKSTPDLKNSISGLHIKCIQKAFKHDLICEEVPASKYLKAFFKLYTNTIIHKDIIKPEFTFFSNLFSHLRKNLKLICVKHKGVPIAITTILLSEFNIFMLYGGMSKAGYEKYAKHFMIYNLIFEYKKKGYKRLVLGTGNTGKDSIYRFKRGFTDNDNFIINYELKI